MSNEFLVYLLVQGRGKHNYTRHQQIMKTHQFILRSCRMKFLQWRSLKMSLCAIYQLLLRIIQILFPSSTTKKNHLFKTSSMVRRMCLWEKITVYDALGRVRKKVLWLQANQTQNSLRYSSYTSIFVLINRCVNFFNTSSFIKDHLQKL